MASKIKGITIEINGEVTQLNKALGEVNKHSRDLKSELRDVERLLKLDPGNTDLLAQKQKLLAESIDNTKNKLETLRDAQKQVAEQFARGEIGEDQYRAVQREIIRTEEELKRLETQLKSTNDKWGEVAGKLDNFGKKATEIGKDLTKKVTAPIAGAGAAVTKMASDFTDSMAKVSTLADASQVSMDDLKKGILDISSATGIASTDIAGSVYDALSAGVETADVLDYVNANVMLTKAGFTEMSTAIDATSTILNAYGDAAYDVTKIGDILVKTQDEGKISVDELGKNLGRVIPTASSLGVNLDQLGTSYAIMTAKGQNANIATTNLNSMLGELGKTGSKSDKALKDMTGKSFKELVSEGKSIGDVLGLLDKHAQDAGLSLSDMFGSSTAGTAALTLISGGVDAFNDKVDIMNSSAGTMAENFEKLQTPSEEMKIALNKIKNAMIELGEIILPILSSVAEWISKVAEKFAGLDDRTKKIIVIIAGLAAAIGPLLIFIGKMSTGISAVIGIVTKVTGVIGGLSGAAGGLSAVIGVLTGPIGIAIAAVAGLIAVGVLLYKNWDKIKECAGKLVEGIKNSWSSIKEVVGKIALAIIDGIKGIPGKMLQLGKDIISGLTDGIKNKISGVKDAVGGIGKTVIGGVKNLFKVQSPSKVMEDIGEQIGEGFAGGIGSTLGKIKSQTLAMSRSVNETITTNNINVGGAFEIKITGEGAGRLNSDGQFVNKVKSAILSEIIQDNRRLPNRVSLMPF